MRELISNRLRDTRPSADPAGDALNTLPESIARAWFSKPLEPAAVLIPLVTWPDGIRLLLTQRTDTVRDHAGQISFPGGRAETGDADPKATALRETAEEIGLREDQVTVAGYLPAYPVVTGYAVVPVVGFVEPGIELRPDPVEVAEAFEVPLEFFLDEANLRQLERAYKGVNVATFEYRFGDHRIWGATAHMIKIFTEIIK